MAHVAILQQYHNGDGDNVAGDKIINHIRLLAPDELIAPIDMVFESLRRKDKAVAEIQMNMLKAMAKHVDESAALVEVISIYGGLVGDQDRDSAWSTVARTVSRAANPLVKDMCQAALLQLAFDAPREEEAKGLYLKESSPGEYAKEAFLRRYADHETLSTAAQAFSPEGVLTGIVEGAIRLHSPQLALEQAKRLNSLYGSYNSQVLLAAATGLSLNQDLEEQHFWLFRPEVKERMDSVRDAVVELLQQSGTDERLHSLGCSIFKIYQGCDSRALFQALKQHLQSMDANRSDDVARFMALAGKDSHLTQMVKDLQAASEDPQKRQEWCRTFLEAVPHPIDEVGPFLRLANSSELSEWLDLEQLVIGGSTLEEACVRLVAGVRQRLGEGTNAIDRHEVGELIDHFISGWDAELPRFNPPGILELAEELLSKGLPHLGLKLSAPLMPSHNLWPSPFVLAYVRCLLEARQNKTFGEVVTTIKGGDASLTLLGLRSAHAEGIGDIEAALTFSQMMIELAPGQPYGWYRRCYLLNRFRGLEEQQAFHSEVPDSILWTPSMEVKGILFFMALAGSFKRAESRWVEWMIESPREHAVDFVNFHFGFSTRTGEDLEISRSIDQCIAAVQYRQEDDSQVRLLVDDHQKVGEFTLKATTPVGQLLLRLSAGESDTLLMTTYTVDDHLPPYVACLRIALQLRGIHNDGSDVFSMMHMPSDPAEFIPMLEKKMSHNNRQHTQMQEMEGIPLYMRGHALFPSDAFKAAINCWTDLKIAKSPLCNIGEEAPTSVVLDAYGIGYLAVTNLAKYLLGTGISFVVPPSTMEALKQFVAEISDEKFMLLGVNDSGRLFRTTSTDLRERDGHILESLRLIIESAVVVRHAVHDEPLEVFAINDSVDTTVYEAMQLSIANQIPWFCMDEAYGALHNSKGHLLVNLQSVLLGATATIPFDFEQRRQSLTLYAFGTLPITLTFNDVYALAKTPNSLAGLILLKIIQNHGREIFAAEGRPQILLNAILLHVDTMFGRDALAVNAKFSPWLVYTSHVFNHGIDLYLALSGGGSAELRLAAAVHYMSQRISPGRYSFVRKLVERFVHFAHGRFMDWEAISQTYLSLSAANVLGNKD